MTLNDVMVVILRYLSEFAYLTGVLRKSSRSLSHLLMSSCCYMARVSHGTSACASSAFAPPTTNKVGVMGAIRVMVSAYFSMTAHTGICRHAFTHRHNANCERFTTKSEIEATTH